MDPWLLIGLCLCISFSAFFSSAETALATLPPSTVERLIQERGHKSLILWRDHPVRTLITILIGNNIVNIAAASLATVAAEKIFQSSGVAIAIGTMTLIILVAGEITPKSFARLYAVQMAPLVMPLITLFYYLFLPFSSALRLGVTSFLKETEADEVLTEKDLLFYINLASHGGKIPKERARMLSSIMVLKDMEVREVMVPRPRVILLNAEDGLPRARELFIREGFSRLPVYKGHEDDIIGILHAKDLLSEERKDLPAILHPARYIPESKGVLNLLKEMQRDRFHFAVIVDEFGTFVGIVTLEDILEEIVGEIEDEYDAHAPSTMVRLQDGSYSIEGSVPIHEVNRRLKTDIPLTGDYETLAGYIIGTTGELPAAGRVVVWKDWQFEVLSADERRVHRIRAWKTSSDAGRESG